ncbi:MAG: polyphosphate kinase 2 [Vicingaceae bacterium]
MKAEDLKPEDIELLNSKIGMYALLKSKKINLQKALNEARYVKTLKEKQEELIKLQKWVIDRGEKVIVIFEGRDAAGKGGAIRRITEHINPRQFRIVALNIPTEDERNQWFFQRYINQFPNPGEMVFFDRSWYNRAVVEPVNGFCTDKEYRIFMSQVNDFEEMLIESGTYLIKFYFSISKQEQEDRFKDIRSSSLKRWKMSPVDENAQDLWEQYTHYKEKMFEKTNTKHSPWKIISANKKSEARLEAISHLLQSIPYE